MYRPNTDLILERQIGKWDQLYNLSKYPVVYLDGEARVETNKRK
jgi:hypothetical protein